ncbi:O-acyltransferase WSD1 [Sesamum indicum]|uniref:O-acyltransferase WSD1 n=1 Tax=Sesamum indicum TaxID=4182 RepID=A0A6I9SYG5_SESIN|nr:O-acyltransferase WSD1 [Sesamum indicum]
MSLKEEPASPTARLMQAPSFNLCILALLGYSTKIDVNLFKKCLERTLLKHPRFSSLLVVNDKKRGKCSWRRTRVDLENHVYVPDLDPDMENPDEFVEDFTSGLSRIPLDYAKPLWEVHILNVKTSDANSVVIFKIHHSMGDGVSMISLVLACSKKLSDPESLPVMPSKKQKQKPSGVGGLMKRWFVSVWIILVVIFNTLIDSALFLATILFLEDSKTPIKGGGRVDGGPKRFVHRIVSLDDVKLVKNAMNVSINDVVLGVTEAGLTRYLKTTYDTEQKHRENGAHVMKKTRALPRHLRLRSAVVFNLRSTPAIQDLAEIMEKEKELNGMWGNLVAIVLLPMTIALQDDPLSYVRRAKATMNRKKLSLESKFVFTALKLLIKLFGIKTAAAVTSAVFRNTTFGFSNVAGPQDEISLFGHPLCYIAPSVHGFPHALIIHCQTYANKLIICLAADENLIPNPHQLCDDLQQSLQIIKETVIKRGLVKGPPLCESV